jgi:hypothetical protein
VTHTTGVERIAHDRHGNAYERDPLDFYTEPADVTVALAQVHKIVGPCVDVACGAGTIPRTLAKLGIECAGCDIVRRYRGHKVYDFLSDKPFPFDRPRSLIFNPPYNAAEAFVLKALEIATYEVVVFTRLQFLAGQSRLQRLYGPHPLYGLYILSARPSCPDGNMLRRGEITPRGGKPDYVWAIWRIGHSGPLLWEFGHLSKPISEHTKINGR